MKTKPELWPITVFLLIVTLMLLLGEMSQRIFQHAEQTISFMNALDRWLTDYAWPLRLFRWSLLGLFIWRWERIANGLSDQLEVPRIKPELLLSFRWRLLVWIVLFETLFVEKGLVWLFTLLS